MSPAWTIVMEQAFNVANDRHCCRSPRFTHGCLPLPYQFYGVPPSFSSFPLSFSLQHTQTFEPSPIPSLSPALAHGLDSSSIPLFLFVLVAFSFQRDLYGSIGRNESVVSAYKRVVVVVVAVWGRDLRAMRGCAHRQKERERERESG